MGSTRPTRISSSGGETGFEIETPVPGVAVLIFGIVIVLISFVIVRPAGAEAPDRPKVEKPDAVSSAVLGADRPAASPAATATASPQITPSPTATHTVEATPAPEDTPTQEPTPVCVDDEPPASRGPWDGCENDVHVIVAKVARTAGGRLRVHLRVENRSDYHVGIPADAFLAVASGSQYEANEDRSNWEFESWDDYDLPPGRRLAGYIELFGPVPSSEKTLRVDLNLSLRSDEYSSDDDEFFFVNVPTRIGS